MLGLIFLAFGLLLSSDASKNGLAEDQCPEECQCHSYSTDCSNLMLESIPNGIDSEVQVLNLSGNKFKDVNLPSTLKSLQQVYISNSSLQTVAFESLPELAIIDLSQNSLTNISAIKLDKLLSLNLSHNRDLEFKSCHGAFISNTLQILDMSSCHVKSLSFLEKLPNLQKLILKENLVKNISTGKSTSLTHLNLKNGRISELSIKVLKKYPNLLHLDITNNRDIHIELSQTNQTECLMLENFVAAGTGVSEIKISTLCKLQGADFSANGINIDKSTFKANIELKSLNISFNEIRNIHKEAFKHNQKLLDLDLTRNLLDNCAWTEYLINLKSLNLSSNRITTLDDLTILNLLYLDVANNKITNISRNLSKRFPKLEYLDLSNNLLDNVSPLGISTLKTLILKYCQILIVEKNSFAKMNKLQYVDLTGNKLMRLDYTELSCILNLQTVRLGNNSWLCDCSSDGLKNLYVYLVVNHSLTYANELVCNEPEKRSWKEVCSAEWTISAGKPGASSLKTAMILLAVLFLALFFMAGLIYIKHRVKSRIIEEDVTAEQPLNQHNSQTRHTSSLRRVQSEVSVRQTTSNDFVDNPPSYEEAILMPPMTDVERMTRSMDVLVERRIALPTIPE